MKQKRARRKGAKKPSLKQHWRRLAAWLPALVLVTASVAALLLWLPAREPRPPQAPSRVVASLPPPQREAPPEAETAPLPALPRRAEQPAWLRFAVAAPAAGNRPRIAIVLDDCGLDRPRTERAMALPAEVTMSFMTYAPDVQRQTEQARRAGHELLVHVPMEPISARMDMGPNGLAIDQPRDEVLRRLRWGLERFDGYVGINNHMGSRFTADAEAMGWVLGELKARGLLFLDSRTVAHSAGASVAASVDLPFVARDVFLDNSQEADAVEARLKDAEAVARKKGTAIAIGHPHEATLVALNLWIATLPEQGIVLVPLTDIVKARAPAE
jgi:polysaccharide deacetylase 2 family uncharacterized protein YibQ